MPEYRYSPDNGCWYPLQSEERRVEEVAKKAVLDFCEHHKGGQYSWPRKLTIICDDPRMQRTVLTAVKVTYNSESLGLLG